MPTGQRESDAGVTVPPALTTVPPLVAGLLLHVLWTPLRFFPEWWIGHAVGWPLVTAGVLLLAWSVRTMSRAGVDPVLDKPTIAIVTTGPSALSRNPIYVSFIVVYVGIALVVNSVWPIAFPAVGIALLYYGIIASEVSHLERVFGDESDDTRPGSVAGCSTASEERGWRLRPVMEPAVPRRPVMNMKQIPLSIILLVAVALLTTDPAEAQPASQDIFDRVEHGFVDSDGVQIHYATIGSGPLMVLIHGYPDFWYLWRYQMAELSADYQVVAIDQRGFNRSDKPKGVAQYSLDLLAGDVAAVVRHFGQDQATIVGHDWGGWVAWHVAQNYPEMTDTLIVFNLPHPRGLRRELATNREQKENSAYARRFQQEGAHLTMSAEQLARRHADDPVVHDRYLEAYRRSDFEGMLNIYKANYPAPPYLEDTEPVVKVQPPVLLFHGLNDTALLRPMLNDTWDWLEQDLTLVTIPNAGHWAVTERAPFVTEMMRHWLTVQANR